MALGEPSGPGTGERRPMRHQSIRVGQRLIRWDGIKGFCALNSNGTRIYGPRDAFRIEWDDGDSEYLTLETLDAEGIRRGKGLMPWAR